MRFAQVRRDLRPQGRGDARGPEGGAGEEGAPEVCERVGDVQEVRGPYREEGQRRLRWLLCASPLPDTFSASPFHTAACAALADAAAPSVECSPSPHSLVSSPVPLVACCLRRWTTSTASINTRKTRSSTMSIEPIATGSLSRPGEVDAREVPHGASACVERARVEVSLLVAAKLWPCDADGECRTCRDASAVS